MLNLLLRPVRMTIHGAGRALAWLGVIDACRADRVADLAWPRIVTGVARMSKSTADVAMVGTALGASAIAGVGYATPYWALAFVFGGGIAGGTISLVSQRYGAGRPEATSVAVMVSACFVLAVTLPLVFLFWAVPEPLIRLIGTGDAAIAYGARYVQVISLSMPFAALNLVASRTLVGTNDARTPMMVRAGGAVLNVALNALFIFVFGWGVVGAADGFDAPLRTVAAVRDADGATLERSALEVRQALPAAPVFLVNSVLERVTRSGTGRALRQLLPGRRVAGKTGTTDDLRDSWFAGFDGRRVAAVWVGRDDNRPAGLTGSSGAMRVWADMMRDLPDAPRRSEAPAGVVWGRVDWQAGHTVPDRCDEAPRLPFLEGSMPSRVPRCSGFEPTLRGR